MIITPLTSTTGAANENPGIVPPWLQVWTPERPITSKPDVPHIMGGAAPTVFDPEHADTTPAPDKGRFHIM